MAGFIKYMRTEEAEFLSTKPMANHLMTVIAMRARRTDHPINGLKAGQCFLGDYSAIGMTRQQYRTALDNLVKWKLITIKATNKGTIATLINTKVYDINGDIVNQPPTIEQPAANQQLTTNKECKKERKEEVNDHWDFERCRLIWNEVKEDSDCIATGCNIVPSSLKSGLPKVHKSYVKYCKESGKDELERHDWFRAYAKGHLRRCSTFVGKNESYSWKPSIKDLGQMKTFEALINQ